MSSSLPIYRTSPHSLTRNDTDALSEPPHRGPRHPGPGSTDTEMCQFFHDMDAWHDTPEGSPLHHEWRCPLHGADVRHRH